MKPSTLIALAVSGIVVVALTFQTLHCNDIDELQIIQNIGGAIEVRRDGGWYSRLFPRIWVYPKASVEICSEADKDAIAMQFSNKTTAILNCQIGYRIDSTNDEQIVRLHQQVEGDDEKIWKKVRTTLQTVAQCVASQYTPSESVEKFPEFAKKIHDAIVHETGLLSEGIDVVSFTCAGLPKYDKETEVQFNRQKEADLAKRLAEAEKDKLESEKIKVEANYAMQIAEQKGQAEAEMAKAVQSAEKEKRLAEIDAQKKVAIQELEKQEELIRASKEKEVAEIKIQKEKEVAKIEAEKELVVAEVAKRTEKENLDRIELVAKQEVAKAEAKKKSVELAGAITEKERTTLEIERDTRIGVAQAYADGIGKMRLPLVMNSGVKGGGTENAICTFFNLRNAALALEAMGSDVQKPVPAKTAK